MTSSRGLNNRGTPKELSNSYTGGNPVIQTSDRELPAATVRFPTIDLMRGYSILAVVLLHSWLRFYLAGYDIRRPEIPRMLIRLFFLNGGNGVTVFFAISGFLITLTSLRRFGSLSCMRISTFYRIRFARIAPLLICVVTVLTGLALTHVDGFQFSAKRAPLWRAVLAVFTFHSNWLEARYGFLPANWNVMWSLSVEEMFYLFFPLICTTVMRIRRGTFLFILVLLAFVAMGPFARSMWSTNDIWLEQSYLGGMDGIALGCLCALLTDHIARRQSTVNREGRHRILVGIQVTGWAIMFLVALGPAWFWKLLPSKPDLYGTLLALSACIVMCASVLRQTVGPPAEPMRILAPIRWFGKLSYEVYLTHEFVVVFLVSLFLHYHPNINPGPKGFAKDQVSVLQIIIWILAILALSAALGWAVSHYISEPMNRRLRGARQPTRSREICRQIGSIYYRKLILNYVR